MLRVAREKRGETVDATYEANPGEVWEESEFWVALTLAASIPTARSASASTSSRPYRPGQPMTMDEYYGWMFENSVPGLPEAAAKEQLTPLAYMRKYGVFKVTDNVYKPYERRSTPTRSPARDRRGRRAVLEDGKPIGVIVDGVAARGLHDAVAPARVLLADARRLGLARARGSALRARARALARPQARGRASSICCRTSGCRRSSTRARR